MAASCYRKIGSYCEAIAKHKEILRLHPNNMECLRYLVNTCSSLGKKDEAQVYEAQLRKLEKEGTEGSLCQPKFAEKMVLSKLQLQSKGLFGSPSLDLARFERSPSPQMAQKSMVLKTCAKRQRIQDDNIHELLPM